MTEKELRAFKLGMRHYEAIFKPSGPYMTNTEIESEAYEALSSLAIKDEVQVDPRIYFDSPVLEKKYLGKV